MSFITTEDKKPFSTNFEKNTIQNKQGTTVRVLRAELKDYLKQNGILK